MKLAVYRYKNDKDNRVHLVLSPEEKAELCQRLLLGRLDRLRAWVTFSGLLAVKRDLRRRGVTLYDCSRDSYLEFSENCYSLQKLPETGRLLDVEHEWGDEILFVLPPLGEGDTRPIQGRQPCTS